MAVAAPLRWELTFRRRLRRPRTVEVVAPTLTAAIARAKEQHELEGWRFWHSRVLSGGEP